MLPDVLVLRDEEEESESIFCRKIEGTKCDISSSNLSSNGFTFGLERASASGNGSLFPGSPESKTVQKVHSNHSGRISANNFKLVHFFIIISSTGTKFCRDQSSDVSTGVR